MNFLWFLLAVGVFGWVVQQFTSKNSKTPITPAATADRISELMELYIFTQNNINVLREGIASLEKSNDSADIELLSSMRIQLSVCETRLSQLQGCLIDLGVSPAAIPKFGK